ncbi:hypothetical protein SDC9_113637 [bioreactor metagenome]|uniref:Uncharacterized protein n=1 Tax=bioreactor metagenome TaxID=1076179 RepID=A0A645BMY4_9ZZZZ
MWDVSASSVFIRENWKPVLTFIIRVRVRKNVFPVCFKCTPISRIQKNLSDVAILAPELDLKISARAIHFATKINPLFWSRWIFPIRLLELRLNLKLRKIWINFPSVWLNWRKKTRHSRLRRMKKQARRLSPGWVSFTWRSLSIV